MLESLPNILLHGLTLRDGQWINPTLRKFSSRQQVYGTVPWPVRGKSSGCLLTEHILERPIVRGDGRSLQGLGAFNVSGVDLETRIRSRRSWHCGQTVLETLLTPLEDFTGVPSDFGRMFGEPGASQDDIHGCFLQDQK